jgi:hypothetical protein
MALFLTVQDTGELAAFAAPPTAPTATETAKLDEAAAKTYRKSPHGPRRCRFELINEFREMLKVDATASDERAPA